MFLFRLIIGFIVFQTWMTTVHAEMVPHDVAVKIIVSEGANQGLKGMTCIGEVLRLRGSTRGFYGYPSNRMKIQPKSVWIMAAEAWKRSAYTHYTKGADHFENIRTFGEPWWAKYCVKTFEYKDHVFYKEFRKQARTRIPLVNLP